VREPARSRATSIAAAASRPMRWGCGGCRSWSRSTGASPPPLRGERRRRLIVEIDHAARGAALADQARQSSAKRRRRPPLRVVCGPKLTRTTSRAAARPSPWRQDVAGLEAARRAGAAGRDGDAGQSNWMSCALDGDARHAVGADGRDARRAPPTISPPARPGCLRPAARAARAARPAIPTASSAAAMPMMPGGSACRGDSPAPGRRPLEQAEVRPAARRCRAGRRTCGRRCDHVGVGQRQLAGALRAVGEQQAARAPSPRARSPERLEDAGLVVGVLDATSGRGAVEARTGRGRRSRCAVTAALRRRARCGARHHARRRRRSAARPSRARSAIASASLAPGGEDQSRPAQRRRDPLAAHPPAPPWPPGLRHGASSDCAQRSSASAIAARAAGRIGVVAA
jgi:hypothetical protein